MSKGTVEIEDLEGTYDFLNQAIAELKLTYNHPDEALLKGLDGLASVVAKQITLSDRENTWRSLDEFEDLRKEFVGLQYLEINQCGIIRFVRGSRIPAEFTLEGAWTQGRYYWDLKDRGEGVISLQVLITGDEWPIVTVVR
jgi:hypothetical protein